MKTWFAKTVFTVVVVLVLACVTIPSYRLYTIVSETNQRFHLRNQATQLLNELSDKRPSSISKAEWEFLVGWTINGHVNCVASSKEINLEQYRNYIMLLSLITTSQQLDMSFFDQVWDFYKTAGPTGRRYDEMHRPTISENLGSAREGCFGIRVK